MRESMANPRPDGTVSTGSFDNANILPAHDSVRPEASHIEIPQTPVSSAYPNPPLNKG
jgi:hypothetical protein